MNEKDLDCGHEISRLTAENETLKESIKLSAKDYNFLCQDLQKIEALLGCESNGMMGATPIYEAVHRIQSENEALREDVEQLRDQFEQYKASMNDGWFELEQERDQLKAALQSVVEAAKKLSFGLVEDEVGGEESEFTRQSFARLQDVIAATPQQCLAQHDAEVIEQFARELGVFDPEYDDQEYIEVPRYVIKDYANQLRQRAKEVRS